MSVKLHRRLIRIPARRRLSEYLERGWQKRYRLKRTCRKKEC